MNPDEICAANLDMLQRYRMLQNILNRSARN
jgi:hypothetical protein